MTYEEYAHRLVPELKSKTTKASVTKVVNDILLKNLPEEAQEKILAYMSDELGAFQVINEQFEIQKQLTVMQMAHQMIAQARSNNSTVLKQTNTKISTSTGGKK